MYIFHQNPKEREEKIFKEMVDEYLEPELMQGTSGPATDTNGPENLKQNKYKKLIFKNRKIREKILKPSQREKTIYFQSNGD